MMSLEKLSLKSLKLRLQNRPTLVKAADQSALFEQFRKQTLTTRTNAQTALEGAKIAAQVLPDQKYDEQRVKVEGAARRVKTLRKDLLEDPAAIGLKTTGDTFAGLTKTIEGALEQCRKTWKQTLEAKLSGRATLIEKLPAHLLGSTGTKLHEVVTKLKADSTRLPGKPSDVEVLRSRLAEFDEAVQNLQLDGVGGKFLQELATENGAPLSMVQNQDVRDFLDKFQLWPAFRVKF